MSAKLVIIAMALGLNHPLQQEKVEISVLLVTTALKEVSENKRVLPVHITQLTVLKL